MRLGRLPMMMRRRLMMEGGVAMVVSSKSAEVPRFRGLFRVPLVGVPALMSGAATLARDLALTLRLHTGKTTAALARPIIMGAGRLRMAVRRVGMQLAFVGTALAMMLRGLPMMMRGGVVMEGSGAMMRGDPAHVTGFPRFPRIPLVGVATFMSGATPLAGDLPLTLRIHAGKAPIAVVISRHG